MESIDWGLLLGAIGGGIALFSAVGRYFLNKAKESDQHLRNDFDALRRELTETKEKHDALEKQVTALTAENLRLRRELDSTIDRLRQQEAHNARLEGQNEVLSQFMAAFGVKELTAIREAKQQKAA